MESPILKGLKAGSQFPFSLLLAHFDEVEAFWEDWWEGRPLSPIERTKTISDDDLILEPTIDKRFADNLTHRDLYWGFLKTARLPQRCEIPRQEYRDAVVSLQLRRLPVTETPTLTFIGGGYGAGKTTTVHYLATHGCMVSTPHELVGVDTCKMLIPEFEIVKMMADGRASQICQLEARAIGDQLFESAVREKRSFSWDSSMSNYDETFEKIERAKKAGYQLQLIAVTTDPETALIRSMRRARETRRFPNPRFFDAAHTNFSKNFRNYVEHFEKVMVFLNDSESAAVEQKQAGPLLIAQKGGLDDYLEVMDDPAFSTFLERGNPK